MDLTGLCDICGKPGRLFSCMLCGRRVCSACFIPERNVCKECIGGRRFKNIKDKITKF